MDKKRLRTFLIPAAVIGVVLICLVAYFIVSRFGPGEKNSSNVGDISDSDTTSYDCTAPVLLNPKYWNNRSAIGRTKFSGNHTITTISEDPYYNFTLANPDILASKLQELKFWDKEVLSTESVPREYVTAQHLCIIATPIEQPYERYVIGDTDIAYQSTSTIYDPRSKTLKLFVYFYPDHYRQQEKDETTFSYTFSYAVMSTLYSIQLPPPIAPVDFEERYAGQQQFMEIFVMRPGDTSPVFRVTNLDWNR